MPRAHLSKRLPDADAIRLFAEHHIVHVRRRKNGEIVAVKHATFGWMSPEAYYSLQKMHDLMPILLEFIKGGYRAKAWLWSTSVDILGVSLPVGGGLALVEVWNLAQELQRTKTVTVDETVQDPGHWETIHQRGGGPDQTIWVPGLVHTVQVTKQVPDVHWDLVAYRAYALLGPWGDVLQILDSASNAVSGTATLVEGSIGFQLLKGFFGVS